MPHNFYKKRRIFLIRCVTFWQIKCLFAKTVYSMETANQVVQPRSRYLTQNRYESDRLRSWTGGSDRTDKNSDMGQTEQTSVTLGGTERTQELAQTEQTQDLDQTDEIQARPWVRPSRPKTKIGSDSTDFFNLGQTDISQGQGVQTVQTTTQVWGRLNRHCLPRARPSGTKNWGREQTQRRPWSD